jgi:hypothetical protein
MGCRDEELPAQGTRFPNRPIGGGVTSICGGCDFCLIKELLEIFMIPLLHTKSPDHASRNEISFPKYTYESGIPPVLRDINSVRF